MQVINEWILILFCVLQLLDDDLETNTLWVDTNFFSDTPARELVRAIENENNEEITKIIQGNPQLLNYQEPQWGLTPLQTAVGKRKYKSAEMLLKLGANPNVRLKIGWPLIFDAIIPEYNKDIEEDDTRMLELLLTHGADPNFNEKEGEMHLGLHESDRSPLILSAGGFIPINKAKLLVEYGANINYSTERGTTAAYEALRCEQIELAYFLIVEKGAKVTTPYYVENTHFDKNVKDNGGIVYMIDYDNPLYPVDQLLKMMYPLDSKEYKLKKEIIKAFEAQGVDYNERKKHLSERQLNQIKDLYPNSWEEYIEKY